MNNAYLIALLKSNPYFYDKFVNACCQMAKEGKLGKPLTKKELKEMGKVYPILPMSDAK